VPRSGLETSVLFEPICYPYQRMSLLVTSNQLFPDWDDFYPTGSMTVGVADRLVHYCQIVCIKGEGYRLQAAVVWLSAESDDPLT